MGNSGRFCFRERRCVASCFRCGPIFVRLCFVLGFLPGLCGETLRIATYNVENYTLADRMTPDGYRKNYPKPEVAKSKLREVIARMNPDVLVLEEMGSQLFLDELRRDLERLGEHYLVGSVLEASDRDRHLAFLSKRPILKFAPHPSVPILYFGKREEVKRGVLEVSLATAMGPLTIFAVHLKSKITDRKDDPLSSLRRRLEARAVKALVDHRTAEAGIRHFVLLGDFNDTAESSALGELTSGNAGSVLVPLAAIDENGDSWTHFYRREQSRSRIDFFLMAPSTAAETKAVAWVFNAPDILVASDHRPVVALLRF